MRSGFMVNAEAAYPLLFYGSFGRGRKGDGRPSGLPPAFGPELEQRMELAAAAAELVSRRYTDAAACAVAVVDRAAPAPSAPAFQLLLASAVVRRVWGC